MRLARYINALAPAEALEAFQKCCTSRRWAEQMVQSRPFPSDSALHRCALSIWRSLGREDYEEAFAGHPQIGADPAALRRKFSATADWSSNEQAGVRTASEATIQALASLNQKYLKRFGYIFIVCASGKSADEMLDLLRQRIDNTSETELHIAAAEQHKITTLRLEKLPQ